MRERLNPKAILFLGLAISSGFFSCEGNRKGHDDSQRATDSIHHAADRQKTIQDSLYRLDSLRKDSVNKLESAKTYHGDRDTTTLLTDSVSPRYIYLTFDDGPLNGSQYVDSIARAKGVKISVFLIGEHDKMSKKLRGYYGRYKENPFVECYNHSFWHAHNKYNTFYANPQTAYEDFAHNEEALGLQHKIVRLPGRNIWYLGERKRIDIKSGASTAELLHENGYKIVGWDCEWKINGVTGNPDLTVSQLYHRMNNLLKKGTSYTKNNVVLLTHDNMYQTKKGQKLLSDLIDSLKRHPNYEFEFARNYPR